MFTTNLKLKINYQHLVVDLFLIVASFYCSLLLRVNWQGQFTFLPVFLKVLPLVVISRLIIFSYMGVYDIIWRYVSAVDAVKLFKAIAYSSIFIIASSFILELGRLPRSLFLIDMILVAILLSGARLARRMVYEHSSSKANRLFGLRTLIYGAGVNGQELAKRLLKDRSMRSHVLGFIDDDPHKFRRSIGGIPVLSNKSELAQIIQNLNIQQLIIAISQPPGDLVREIIQVARAHNLRPKMITSSLNDSKLTDSLRTVELRDLLRRPPHDIDLTSTSHMLKNKKVLITGAGGSIGSEIARQVLSFDPSRLIILDHSEFNLYGIDQELRASPHYLEKVVPALADVKHFESLNNIMKEYRPDVVFHAAAYKHVHLVESNPYSAILNNIAGTKNLIDLSLKLNVETFLLISTDKAVNPAGIMGATKRVCEMLVAMAARSSGKQFCAVRFGNVLGSSGSLIPLLKKQIEEGEPITITHPEVTRYFMLIEEAVSLVLKAGSIAKSGDINVLRMGDPVKIIDIAKSLISLMGKTEVDVPIEFVGLRPGEKMFEELYISGKELSTEHPDILVLPKGDAVPANWKQENFESLVNKMIQDAELAKKEAIFDLTKLIDSNYKEFHNQFENDSDLGIVIKNRFKNFN